MKKKNYRDETIATHEGRNPSKYDGTVNMPVTHASTIIFDNYEDYKKANLGKYKKSHYGRHGTEANRQLENALAKLEGADKCLLTCSGVSAISTALLAFLNPGDELLMVDSVYSPTRDFCDQELKRLGISTRYYDPKDINVNFNKNTKVIFTESPGSLTFELQDIPKLAKRAHEKKIIVMTDNTWASPLYFKAFEKGVDVSIHSATKYIAGHSDLLMGVINCTEKTYKNIKRVYKNLGICPGPDDVYLAQRGLRTIAARLEMQSKNALELAKKLEKHKKIAKVLHPALKTHPDHKIWKRDFLGSTGLFTIILKRHLSEKEKSKFFDNLDLFGLGFSWGGYESLMIPFDPSKVRTATKWEAEGTAIRISIGLENIVDLAQELEQALEIV